MFQSPRLAELEQAQQLLIAKSDLQRNLLQAEVLLIGRRLDWTQTLQEKVVAGRRWLIPAAALAGLVAWRGGGKLLRWVPTALAAWRMISPWLRLSR